MAERISRTTSSRVAPVATHPGRSGTYAEKFLGVSSITMVYSMVSSLLKSGLSHDAALGATREFVAGLPRDRYCARLPGMPELAVTAAHSDLPPCVSLQRANRIADGNRATSVAHPAGPLVSGNPSTTCLYSAASIEPRSASAIDQSSDSSIPMGDLAEWLAGVERCGCLAGMWTAIRLLRRKRF